MDNVRPRSVVSFVWILVLSVIATAIFSLVAGYFIGSNDLAGEFSSDQVMFIDGLVYGTQVKTEREQWVKEFQDEQVPANDIRAYPTQRCAGKFFPDQPVAMKGCIAAQEPRPPKGYQYP
jgi:hypothetical protein